MTPLWRRFQYRSLARLAFHRISVLHPERLPGGGPVLYLGLHRNGAVDGFVYSSVLPRATFMISTQLRRGLLGRLFFSGIEVVRGKDGGDRGANDAALERCREHLRSGGELFIFPEGTSSLGPRHLPFKSGAARLLLDAHAQGIDVTVVPLGITYESPTDFRSNVEVVVGHPIATDLSGFEGPRDRLVEIKRRMERALEDVGINVPSGEYQEKIEKLAYASTLGTPRSYHESLKAFERAIPEKVESDWRALETDLQARPFTHQGIPLVPVRHGWLYLAALALLAPVVLAGALVNLVPLAGGWLAGRTLPDGRNVIALWRLLVGAPLLFLWTLAAGVASFALGKPLLFAAYALLTLLSIALAYRVKKLSVAAGNWLFHRRLRAPLLAFRETLLEALPHDAR